MREELLRSKCFEETREDPHRRQAIPMQAVSEVVHSEDYINHAHEAPYRRQAILMHGMWNSILSESQPEESYFECPQEGIAISVQAVQ